MINYVKFMRGSTQAFEKLENKNADTLYFISDVGQDYGRLYLGNKEIVCNNNEDLVTSLAQLTDVQLPEPLMQNDVLTYHIDEDGSEYWTAKRMPQPDERALSLKENDLTLYHWGLQYYHYVPATGSVEEGNYIESHYEIQLVDEGHPWIAGLEPRVTLENEELVLGWFEPNTSSLDGVADAVTILQKDVADLDEALKNTYTKEETIQEINKAVAEANHLTYKVVSSLDEIDPEAANADKYIYLVTNGDVYDEYMVIEGKLEKVGDWTVDLSNYVTNETLTSTLSDYVTKTDLEAVEKDFITKDEFTNVVGDTALLENTTLVNKIIEVENRLIWGDLDATVVE